MMTIIINYNNNNTLSHVWKLQKVDPSEVPVSALGLRPETDR
jgi:hypothetical protein